MNSDETIGVTLGLVALFIFGLIIGAVVVNQTSGNQTPIITSGVISGIAQNSGTNSILINFQFYGPTLTCKLDESASGQYSLLHLQTGNNVTIFQTPNGNCYPVIQAPTPIICPFCPVVPVNNTTITCCGYSTGTG